MNVADFVDEGLLRYMQTKVVSLADESKPSKKLLDGFFEQFE